MNIILDNRENSLIKLFNDYNNENIKVNVSQLPLGDIIIQHNNVDLILIERKTYADLLASIKDSRFSEQSYRLSNTSSLNTHSIIYLIEGNISDYPENEKKIIYSAIISLYYYKGFSVFRTYNITETFDYIRNLSEKILRESLPHIGYAMYHADYHVGVDSGMMHIAQFYKSYDQIHIHNEGFKSHHLYRAVKNGSKLNYTI